MKYQVYLVRQFSILVVFQSQTGLSEVTHNRDDPVFIGLTGQTIELQILQHSVAGPS